MGSRGKMEAGRSISTAWKQPVGRVFLFIYKPEISTADTCTLALRSGSNGANMDLGTALAELAHIVGFRALPNSLPSQAAT